MCYSIYGQINVEQIDIYRDVYGVPHIYANSDKNAAYGLAWAHAEDDCSSDLATARRHTRSMARRARRG